MPLCSTLEEIPDRQCSFLQECFCRPILQLFSFFMTSASTSTCNMLCSLDLPTDCSAGTDVCNNDSSSYGLIYQIVILKDHQSKTYYMINISTPSERNIALKDVEKYKYLGIEINRMWNIILAI